VLILTSPQIVQGLRFRQLGLLVGFLLTSAAWCVARDYLATAGMLLAISTIKPQMVLLVLLWFLLWAARRWRARWPLLAGFGGMLAALVGSGELLLPGWIGYFLQGLTAYRKYFPTMSLLEAALGNFMGRGCAGVMIVILLGFAWKYGERSGGSQQFAAVLAAFFLATTLAMPLIPPYNQVMLILPVFLLLRDWPALSFWTRIIFIFCFGWPVGGAIALLLLSNYIHAPSRLALLPSFVAPLVPFILPVLLVAWRRSIPKASHTLVQSIRV